VLYAFKRGNVEAPANSELNWGSQKPTDKVTILGNREIELLLTLARQGFIEVTCRETAGGPHAESDDADLVLVPMVKSETEFALAAAHPRFRGTSLR